MIPSYETVQYSPSGRKVYAWRAGASAGAAEARGGRSVSRRSRTDIPNAWAVPASMWFDEDKAVEAFRTGPLAMWRSAFAEVWARAEARGEVRPGLDRSVTAETVSALIVQRWLLTGEPLDEAYVDAVFQSVVLPLLDRARPTA